MSLSHDSRRAEAAAGATSDRENGAVDKDSASGALELAALALGTFCIGTTEFASMGMIPLFADGLTVDLPAATHAITAYAVGVAIGASVLTLAAARLNRRTLLLALVALFIFGNLLSAAADTLGLFVVARFVTGLPQGADFGVGAVVATHVVGRARAGQASAIVMTGLTVATIVGSPLATVLGQTLGWRQTYLAIASLGVVAFGTLWLRACRAAPNWTARPSPTSLAASPGRGSG
jgi:DHA1 family inner membrane transport protein